MRNFIQALVLTATFVVVGLVTTSVVAQEYASKDAMLVVVEKMTNLETEIAKLSTRNEEIKADFVEAMKVVNGLTAIVDGLAKKNIPESILGAWRAQLIVEAKKIVPEFTSRLEALEKATDQDHGDIMALKSVAKDTRHRLGTVEKKIENLRPIAIMVGGYTTADSVGFGGGLKLDVAVLGRGKVPNFSFGVGAGVSNSVSLGWTADITVTWVVRRWIEIGFDIATVIDAGDMSVTNHATVGGGLAIRFIPVEHLYIDMKSMMGVKLMSDAAGEFGIGAIVGIGARF